MEITLPKNVGSLEEDRCIIEMEQEDGILTSLTNGDPFAPVEVTIYEVTLSASPGPSRTTATTFIGDMRQGGRNINGRRGMVRLIAQGDKQLMEVAMGQQVNHLCSNALGDARCQVDMSVGFNSYFGQIQVMDDRELTIDIAAMLTNDEDRYFERGYLSYQGLRIMIREWSAMDPSRFVLVRRPPASWLLATVLIASGCDKSIETCRSRYENEDHFNGPGYAIPAYNPWIEDASGV